MRTWNVDMVVTFSERGMGGDALRKWHYKFADIGTSQTCKCKQEFKVITAEAGEVLTSEVLNTDLHITACLEAGVVYWYVGAVVMFATLKGRTENVLTERLGKTTLTTLRLHIH